VVVGVLALLLGSVALVWLCTALAALITHGRLPHPLPFLDTATAIRHLATSPNNLAAAWPGTPPAQLPSATAFWVMFFLLLAVLAGSALSIAISLARMRAKAAAAREGNAGKSAEGERSGRKAGGPEAAAPTVRPRAQAEERWDAGGAGSGPAAGTAGPVADGWGPQGGGPLGGGSSGGGSLGGGSSGGGPLGGGPVGGPTIPRPSTEPASRPADGTAPPMPAVPAGNAAVPRLGRGTACVFVPTPSRVKQRLLTDALAEHAGPALVLTSARSADALPQRPPHASTGGLLFDPLRLLPDEEAAAAGLTRLRWAPHSGCEDPSVATARARALLAPLRPATRPAVTAQLPNHLSTAAAHDTARTLLRCWLHAAALDGRPIRQVHRWATGHQTHEAVRILRTTTSRQVAEGWGGELEVALTAHPQLRDGAQALVRTALGALAELHVLQACTPSSANERLEVESFLHDRGILYVAGPASEQRITPESGSVMPLLTALADDVVEHGRRMAAGSPAGRLDPPLLSLLDDVAAVAPLPSLPELLDRGSSLGLPTIAVLRSPEQARARWGTEATHSLWTKAGLRIVTGSADPALLRPVVDELVPGAPLPGVDELLLLAEGQLPAITSAANMPR
jgi:hypothetical protein